MILKKWDDLPEFMKCDEVKVYYDILSRKKGSLVLKRIFDIVVGVILLILLSIPMLIIAVMIKMDSKGPVFYRQERVTRYGKKFRINCILLMPYGCLLPVALDKRINWKRGLVIGMGTSFVIELLQLITCRGLFEFDDIIHNGFGCMMGAVLGSWCWLRMLKKFKMPRKPHAS